MRLPKRFLILPIVLAVFSYLFYNAYKEVRVRTQLDFNNEQYTLARQASRGIESFFIYYQRELQLLCDIPEIINLNDKGKDLLTNFYKHHSDQIEAITYVDSKGILQYTFPLNNGAIGRDISMQPHISAVIQTKKPVISEVFTSVQGFRTIAYHVPIVIDNKFEGSIAILIPLDALGKRFVENIKSGSTGYGWMISKEGIELYNPSNFKAGQPVNEIFDARNEILSVIEKSRKENFGSEVCMTGPAGRQIPMHITYYRVALDNTYWTILISTPEEEIYAPLTSFRNRLYFISALILLFSLIYSYLSYKASNILIEEKKRKAVEKTLLDAERRFRAMFELSPAGIILIDIGGTIIEVNSSFCKTIGYSRKEVIGRNIRLFASPADDAEIEDNIASILDGKTMTHEVTNIRKDGTVCCVALYETRITLPDGTPGILSVSNDITEKKKEQERMLTLSRAMESISECVSITDYKNRVIFVNKAFCKTYQYDESELIGKDISLIRVNNYDAALASKILEETINGGWSGELINVRKDGTEFPIELSTSLIKDENGEAVALIGIATDITERRKVQDELINAKEKAEESDKLKSAFLANISHELRTPLNAIIGFSDFMVESGPDMNTVAYSQVILNSGRHLLGLVEDVFDIAMIETGQVKVTFEKTDITELLKEVRDIIHGERMSEDKTKVEVILRLLDTEKNKFLVTDGRKLRQVLLNLLRNALKFTDAGYIEYGYDFVNDSDRRHFSFYVKDTGIGIDKKHHETIFNVFRQVDDTHTRKFGGMGIGLSIAKKTIELLGGRIWVESEHGKGSTFYFTLPVRSEENFSILKQDEKYLNMEKDYSGKTVLVAEDEQSNFDFLKILLNRMNIKVLWAKDGLEAVQHCENDPSINLVLMDIKMPNLNGYEATKRIKTMRPGLPVIAQTAYAMISDKLEADRAGCDGYLAKPIKIYQIAEVLEAHL